MRDQNPRKLFKTMREIIIIIIFFRSSINKDSKTLKKFSDALMQTCGNKQLRKNWIVCTVMKFGKKFAEKNHSGTAFFE